MVKEEEKKGKKEGEGKLPLSTKIMIGRLQYKNSGKVIRVWYDYFGMWPTSNSFIQLWRPHRDREDFVIELGKPFHRYVTHFELNLLQQSPWNWFEPIELINCRTREIFQIEGLDLP